MKSRFLLMLVMLLTVATSFAGVNLQKYSMYLTAATATAGKTVDVTLGMKNDKAIVSWATTLVLPEGVTFVSATATGNRYGEATPTVTSQVNENGTVSLMCEPDATMTGSRGVVATITLQVGATVADGVYKLALNGATLVDVADNTWSWTDVIETDLIVGGTEISLYDNIVFFENPEVFPGKTTSVPLYMNNKDEITAVQFDMTLPTGVTLDGKVTVNTTDGRATSGSHSVTSSVQSNGKVRVVCYSMSLETFKGESGAIFNIPLKVDESMADGIYSVRFDDIIMTEPNGNKHTVESFLSQFEVVGTVIGDCNNDGCVDVADIVTMVNYILGKAPAKFVERAADVNGDSSIDVADIVSLVNMLLHPQNSVSKKVNARRVEESSDSEANTLTIAPFEIKKGGSKTVTLDLHNTDTTFTAFQCDLYLPEGVTAGKPSFNSDANRTDATHGLFYSVQSDGSLRIVCYSGNNSIFKGNDGALVDIPLTSSADMKAGSYEYSIKNIILSKTDATKFTPSDYTGTMSVIDNADGINGVEAAEQGEDKVFNLSGMRLSAPVKGKINIVNNKKVLVR